MRDSRVHGDGSDRPATYAARRGVVTAWSSIHRRRLLTVLVAAAICGSGVTAHAFDFDTGHAPLEVVIPAAVPAVLEVSPGVNDASLVLRITSMVSNCWFDAIAPYHPTAVGVYSRLGRRPADESVTNRNKNIAILYASYHILGSLFPRHSARWQGMLLSVGLDPHDDSEDATTPVGIGNLAGRAIVAVRERDGMNQLGDEGGRRYSLQPYADYTGYQPVNTAYELRDPGRWQPNIVTRGNGLFQVQQFVTPQWRVTLPYSYDNPNAFRVPTPAASNPKNKSAYQSQADEVLAASAGLTDYQKMAAELFDHKLRSLGASTRFINATRNLSLDEFVQLDFLSNMTAFDAGIAMWNEKTRHDAVRPFSAIRYLYGDQHVTAWGGPGKGTVTDLPASQWRSYLNTADHPEYPSGSACFCSAHAQASRRFLGSDTLGFSIPLAKGSSSVEPGITPASDIVLGPWATWTDFERECGVSRVWGGVHFMSAVKAAQQVCPTVGDRSYEFLRDHLEGVASEPEAHR
jgi:hypothetical protein